MSQSIFSENYFEAYSYTPAYIIVENSGFRLNNVEFTRNTMLGGIYFVFSKIESAEFFIDGVNLKNNTFSTITGSSFMRIDSHAQI
jgi:hypothetical protein